MQDDPLRLRVAWHTTRFNLAYDTSRPCQLYFDLTYAWHGLYSWFLSCFFRMRVYVASEAREGF